MKFTEYYNLNERLGSEFRNLIVVDVQPLYEENITKKFSIEDFGNFLTTIKKNILYFYNGPETIASEDSQEAITEWLIENNSDLENFEWDKVTWLDKGYSYYRGWMDYGITDNGMKQALRYMAVNRKHDSRDIPVDVWKNVLPATDYEHLKDIIEIEPIWEPDISISELKDNWNGSLLAGGAMNECLKEIQLLLNAFNINYKLVDSYIYY
ncbi:MAG: hypothetical protein PHF86_09310 [Candidatus Nanoarchaeia archaeon]|nr:hypothetical protein [Candidatus Nanoarchaeia archaeon]